VSGIVLVATASLAVGADLPAAASPARSLRLAGAGAGAGAAGGAQTVAAGRAAARRAVPAYGVLSGVVRGIGGGALAGVCVTAAAGGSASALTQADGRYLLAGLAPGLYTIRYHACDRSGRYLDQWYGGSVQAQGATRVLVAAGVPTLLRPVALLPATPAPAAPRLAALKLAAPRWAALRRAALRSAASGGAGAVGGAGAAATRPVLSGIVTGRSGKGLAGICVNANQVASGGPGAPPSGSGTATGRGGRYSFPAFMLPPGKWTISFFAGCGNPGNYAPQWWRHRATAAKATVLRVRRGSHFVRINAKLVVGAAVTGVVRAGRASGPGLRGVCVLAQGLGAMSDVFQEAVTGAGGRYRLVGLGTGRYQVQFAPGCGNRGDYLGSQYRRAVSVRDGKTAAGINGFLLPGAEIRGTVTTGPSKTPVAGICVGAQGAGDQTEVTGPAGTYVLPGLSAGRYLVSFTGGCGNPGSYAPQYFDGQASPAAAIAIALTTGKIMTGVNASMLAGGTLTGIVTNGSGSELPGICVAAISAQAAGGLGPSPLGGLVAGAPLFGGLALSGNAGYRIGNLMPGSYEVSFSSCGAPGISPPGPYAAQWFAPQGGPGPDLLSVPGGTVTSGIDVRLRATGAVTGVVTNAAGKPLGGICPLARPLAGQPIDLGEFFDLAQSNRFGGYRLTGLAPGRYAVRFVPCNGQPLAASWYSDAGSLAAARPVVDKDGQTTVGINQVMAAGQSVSGQVRSGLTGRPAGARCVVAVDSGGNPAGVVTDDSLGRYDLTALAAGRYSLEFINCSGTPSRLADLSKPGVQVGGRSPVTGLNVTLPAGASMTGQVTGGNPVAAVPGSCVEATPKAGSGVPEIGFTKASGQYLLTGLAAGQYLVQFTPYCVLGAGAFVPRWYDGQPTAALATPVAVTAGATTSGIGATLVADGAISGTVRVSGAPVAGVCVIAYPVSGGQAPAIAETAVNGTYQISGLAPGSYTVEFTAGCGIASYTTQWYNAAASQGTATPVSVSAGEVAGPIDAS